MLPTSFNEENLQRIEVMITDGDSQEYAQLDVAIKNHFPNAYRACSAYHVNSKVWEKHGPNIKNYDRKEMIKQCTLQMKIITDWIYSWMKSGCETELQYQGSKYFLLEYLTL